MRTAKPTVRCGEIVVKQPIMPSEPGGDPSRAAVIAALSIQEVGALMRLDRADAILEVPRRQGDPFCGFGAVLAPLRLLEPSTCVFPTAPKERLSASVQGLGCHSGMLSRHQTTSVQ